MMLLVFARKKPVERMMSSTSAGAASARLSAVGNRAKSKGVTRFTRSSVHWAERIVATASSKGFRYSSAQRASGWVRSKRSRISAASFGEARLDGALLGFGSVGAAFRGRLEAAPDFFLATIGARIISRASCAEAPGMQGTREEGGLPVGDVKLSEPNRKASHARG